MLGGAITHVPTVEDLYGLRKLCGDDDATVSYLSRLYNLPRDAIAPTVKSWLAELPHMPPPSRQRSAPPVVAPGIEACLRAAASSSAAGQPKQQTPADVMRIDLPPPSAPVQGKDVNVAAAMRALDSRLNRSTHRRQPIALPEVPASEPCRFLKLHGGLGRVPEEVPIEYIPTGHTRAVVARPGAHDGAAAAYLERAALLHGRGQRLEPRSGGKRDVLPSTWMTRK